MPTRQELIPVKLANGSEIRVAATMLGGDENVAFKLLSFEAVTNTIEGIAGSLNAALQKVNPKKASVEFGLEVAVESGSVDHAAGERRGHGDVKDYAGMG